LRKHLADIIRDNKRLQLVTGKGPLKRYIRDARIARYFDGSSEVHRDIIARMLLAD
jgi:alkylation response protein AidB-like acyl-CoA dehydrogenase